VAASKGFLGAAWSRRWAKAYAALSVDQKKGTDKVVIALIKQEPTPGMRVKPIEPDKYFYEARINDGDRLVFLVEDGKVWFVEVIAHDDIGRYGRKIEGLF
jgi:Txe/YoeB family toxin of Txe-Axe toxin-antitoxin module